MRLKSSLVKKILIGAVLLCLVLGLSAAPLLAEKRVIKIGWVAWSETEPVAYLLKNVFEDMGYEVELLLSDIGVVYTGVAGGDLDIGLEAWLPLTHEAYWDKFSTEIILLPMYEGARLGWAIPDYIPKDVLSSVEDMGKAEVKEKLKNQVIGIDPGAGLTQHSELMIKEGYPELKGYTLVEGSGAMMLGALKRAIARNEWIVTTNWAPDISWASVSKAAGGPGLRWLDEPKKILGGEEFVAVIVGRKFYENLPSDITGFLSRMWFDMDEILAMMAYVIEGLTTEEAAQKYIEDNPLKINYWKTGEISS